MAAARQLLVPGQGGFALPSAGGLGGRRTGPSPLAQVLAGVIVVVVDVDVDVEVADAKHLTGIAAALRACPSVETVERVRR